MGLLYAGNPYLSGGGVVSECLLPRFRHRLTLSILCVTRNPHTGAALLVQVRLSPIRIHVEGPAEYQLVSKGIPHDGVNRTVPSIF